MFNELIRTTQTKPKFLTSKSYDSNSLQLRNASSKENMYEVSFSLHTCISNYIIKILDIKFKTISSFTVMILIRKKLTGLNVT